MKVIIFFILLVAGINAWPHSQDVTVFHSHPLPNINWHNERFVTDSIASAIQDGSQAIIDAGLDPLDVNHRLSYALPVPVLFSIDFIIDSLHSNGLSNIKINNLNFSILTNRLRFDIELPRIEASLAIGDLNIGLFGSDFKASASGSLAINRPRLSGNARFSVGIITGVSLRSVNVDFSLGGIESALNVVIQQIDISNWLNTQLSSTIPRTLNEFSKEINELFEIIATQVIEANL